MKVMVIVAHPARGSFNHAIASAACSALEERGHRVLFHDLYEEKFDPLLTSREIRKGVEPDPAVMMYIDGLRESRGIVFVHPNWWGQPPAILTGWIDRVFRPGIAYRFSGDDGGEGVPEGLLRGKKALVFNTSDTPEMREKEFFGDPLESIWKKCIFEFCGITDYFRKTFSVIVTSTPGMRARWLEEVAADTGSFFPENS